MTNSEHGPRSVRNTSVRASQPVFLAGPSALTARRTDELRGVDCFPVPPRLVRAGFPASEQVLDAGGPPRDYFRVSQI